MATKVLDTVVVNKEGRTTFTTSTGGCLMVLRTNIAGVRTIQVWETTQADRKTGWTLRGTLTITSLNYELDYNITAAMFTDNSLGILFTSGSNTNNLVAAHYVKFTYAGYTFGTIETVFSGALNAYLIRYVGGVDIDVSAAGFVSAVVSYKVISTGLDYARVLTRTAAGSWANYVDQSLGSNGVATYATLVTLGITGSTRRLVVATSLVYTSAGDYMDSGVTIRSGTINESTGAIPALTTQYTYFTQVLSYADADSLYRLIKLFRGNTTNEFVLGVAHGWLAIPKAGFGRGSWDGTGFSWMIIPYTYNFYNPLSVLGTITSPVKCSMGMTIGSNALQVYFVADHPDPGSAPRVGTMQFLWAAPTGETHFFLASGQWFDGAATSAWGIGSGGCLNISANKHDNMIIYSDQKPYHHYSALPPAPTGLVPVNGTTVTSSTPNLQAVVQYSNVYWAPVKARIQWQISQDSSFATGVKDYLQSGAPYVNYPDPTQYAGLQWMDGTQATPKTISDFLPASLALNGGFWYMRARVVDSLGNEGPWVGHPTLMFTIGHPPVAIPTSPLNNQKYEYATGSRTFTWDFTDPSPTDAQTAYQFRLKTDVSGTVIHDSGKIVSAAKSYSYVVPVGYKNVSLYWEVRLWDTDDSAGLYSAGNSFFQLVDPGVATMTYPASGNVVTTATPTVQATVNVSGSNDVKEYTFRILRSGIEVWSSGTKYGTFPNLYPIEATVANGFLVNNTNYSIQVLTRDLAGINMASPIVAFSTAWTPVVSVTTFSADVTAYNTDGLGYVTLSWLDANREAGFVAWKIYRRTDLIDPNTQAVVQTGTYELVHTDYRATAGTYTWRDYLAPSGQKVNYLIKQLVNRGSGFIVESENTVAAECYPQTDGYWLIDSLDPSLLVTKIALVTADTFTDEQEEASYNVIGRGRHVDKGQYLGPAGSLTIQIRHSAGSSARMKRLRLLDIQNSSAPMYLRNPFGDVFKVNVSSMQVGRLSGVGVSEFCDVTLPYSKVG